MVEKTKKACVSVFTLLTILLVCILGLGAVAAALIVSVSATLLALFRSRPQQDFTAASRIPVKEYRAFDPGMADLRQPDKKAS